MASLRTRRGILPLIAVAAIAATSQPALGANVLVAGSAPGASTIKVYLESLGHSVTYFSVDTLPTSLAPYSAVWVHTTNSLGVDNLLRLEAFVESGRGVYINGEHGLCCAEASANGDLLVDLTVAGSGSIIVGGGFSSGSLNGSPNATAVGGITQTPYAPPHMALAGAGNILGVAAGNQLITSAGNVLAAAWSDADMASGAGRIVIVMDSNWIASGDIWVDEWVANLQHFLQGPDSDGDGIPDVTDSCTDSDDDGFGDPGHPIDTCDPDACPSVPGVAPDGCAVAVPALSAGWRLLLGVILVAVASPPTRAAVRRIGIDPAAKR